VLNNGGAEYVSSGAVVSGTTANSGSIDYVFAGGSAIGTHLNGGQQID
jgi:autotransporter passenger strand-loop-strand repeat protein